MVDIIDFQKRLEEKLGAEYTTKIGNVGILTNDEVAFVELINGLVSIDHIDDDYLGLCFNEHLASYPKEDLLLFCHVVLRFFDSDNEYDVPEGIEVDYYEYD